MKRSILMTLLLLFCLSARAETGGISGGGGGTTNPAPIGSSKIQEFIPASKVLLQAYLSLAEIDFKDSGSGDAHGAFLFDRGDDVFTYVAKVEVEVRSTEFCVDSSGQNADGSVFSNHPNAICISSYSLGQKLNEFNFMAETAALILHEVVHQMGGDEATAVGVQLDAVRRLHRVEDVQEKLGLFRYELMNLSGELRTFINSNYQNPNVERFVALRRTAVALREETSIHFGSISPWRFNSFEEFKARLSQLFVLGEYAYGFGPEELMPHIWQQRYARGFNGKAEVTVTEYFRNVDNYESRDSLVVVKKVTSQDIWQSQITEAAEALLNLVNEIQDLQDQRFKIYPE